MSTFCSSRKAASRSSSNSRQRVLKLTISVVSSSTSVGIFSSSFNAESKRQACCRFLAFCKPSVTLTASFFLRSSRRLRRSLAFLFFGSSVSRSSTSSSRPTNSRASTRSRIVASSLSISSIVDCRRSMTVDTSSGCPGICSLQRISGT